MPVWALCLKPTPRLKLAFANKAAVDNQMMRTWIIVWSELWRFRKKLFTNTDCARSRHGFQTNKLIMMHNARCELRQTAAWRNDFGHFARAAWRHANALRQLESGMNGSANRRFVRVTETSSVWSAVSSTIVSPDWAWINSSLQIAAWRNWNRCCRIISTKDCDKMSAARKWQNLTNRSKQNKNSLFYIMFHLLECLFFWVIFFLKARITVLKRRKFTKIYYFRIWLETMQIKKLERNAEKTTDNQQRISTGKFSTSKTRYASGQLEAEKSVQS